MYTLYKLNADELNENFLASIKAQFQHKDIEIVICETAESEHDETQYLLANPANKARLLAAMDNVSQGHYVTVDLDAWS